MLVQKKHGTDSQYRMINFPLTLVASETECPEKDRNADAWHSPSIQPPIKDWDFIIRMIYDLLGSSR